jgi:hypothetical protein
MIDKFSLTQNIINKYKVILITLLPVNIIDLIIDQYIDNRILCKICDYKFYNFNKLYSNNLIHKCFLCENNYMCHKCFTDFNTESNNNITIYYNQLYTCIECEDEEKLIFYQYY